MKPRLLDLFCGAGGAAMGYSRAGFEVVGVDIKPQPHYPFEFVQADALEWLTAVLNIDRVPDFDAIHASPPCQLFSRAGHLRDAQGGKSSAVNLIPEVQYLLELIDLPSVIENVPGAPLFPDVTLCGSMFGLRVRRHRVFEFGNWPATSFGPGRWGLAEPACHHKAQGRPVGVYHVMNDHVPSGGTTARDLEEGQEAMGIDWMTWPELKEAIPPAYTEWIGTQLLAQLRDAA